MALLEWGGKRIPVATGELVLGSDAGCAVQLTGPGVLAQHAVIQGMPDGQVVIRKAVPQAEVVINGVRLGAEPTPLLHGDKVEVGGHELAFVDERRSGSTQYIQAMPQGLAAAADAVRAARPTGNTGGRVVSLTDGREYTVAGSSLVFGREAGCDVVVTGKDVSRRHAEIKSTAAGYVLVDTSTNGTQVNGERVQGQRLLARADVIAIGEETFRFYADTIAAAPPPPPAPAPPPPPAPEPPAPSQPAPAAPAAGKLQNTVMGPPTPRPSVSAPLATFVARSGALKGQRFVVKTPVANIGRADYNDIVVADGSISTAHAKLQRREGVWVLIDLDSSNGTFVDGERIKGEAPLSPGATVRFGEVSFVFEPTDDAVSVQKGGGTRVIEVMKPPAPPPPPPAPKPAPAKPAAARPAPTKRPVAKAPVEKKKGKGCGASVIVLALGASAFLYWLVV